MKHTFTVEPYAYGLSRCVLVAGHGTSEGTGLGELRAYWVALRKATEAAARLEIFPSSREGRHSEARPSEARHSSAQ